MSNQTQQPQPRVSQMFLLVKKIPPPREIYASAAAVVATAMIVYLGDSFSRGENICDTQYSDGNPRNGGVECSWGRQKSRF